MRITDLSRCSSLGSMAFFSFVNWGSLEELEFDGIFKLKHIKPFKPFESAFSKMPKLKKLVFTPPIDSLNYFFLDFMDDDWREIVNKHKKNKLAAVDDSCGEIINKRPHKKIKLA